MNIRPAHNLLRRIERLRGDIRTEKLFASGNGFIVYPLRVVYLQVDYDENAPVSVLFSVPKKRIRLAVNRNRIKRLHREAYRLNKQDLIAEMGQKKTSLHLGIVYLGNEMPDFETIRAKMLLALQRIRSAQ